MRGLTTFFFSHVSPYGRAAATAARIRGYGQRPTVIMRFSPRFFPTYHYMDVQQPEPGVNLAQRGLKRELGVLG